MFQQQKIEKILPGYNGPPGGPGPGGKPGGPGPKGPYVRSSKHGHYFR